MATYVLIHGAGSDSWYWGPLATELRARGHDVVAPDLPLEDDTAGWEEYADAVVRAIGDRTNLVVVAHSLGGFVGPLVCARVPVDLLVMLHPMIPTPGETFGEWWHTSAYREARAAHDAKGATPPQDDTIAYWLHDTPPDLAAESLRHEQGQSDTPLGQPWPLTAWPDIPTKVLISRGDHAFPPDALRRMAKERLGITADEMDGDHSPMLGHPKEVAERLVAYWERLAE